MDLCASQPAGKTLDARLTWAACSADEVKPVECGTWLHVSQVLARVEKLAGGSGRVSPDSSFAFG